MQKPPLASFKTNIIRAILRDLQKAKINTKISGSMMDDTVYPFDDRQEASIVDEVFEGATVFWFSDDRIKTKPVRTHFVDEIAVKNEQGTYSPVFRRNPFEISFPEELVGSAAMEETLALINEHGKTIPV